jgi:hypothetical protein
MFVKTLSFSQKGGILSIYRDSEPFKRLIYFQKCDCVLLMRGILTEKLSRLFSCTTLLVMCNITVNMCTDVCTCSS